MMAGASVSVSAAGFARIDAMLSRLVNPDFNPLLDAIGGMVETQTGERFKSTKTAPDGTAWQALSPDYAKRKKKNKRKILELEGDLRDALTHLVTGKTSVEVGMNVLYAATHQYGDESRGIPQRQFLGLSTADEEAINKLIDTWFEQVTGDG
jgi:phage virion morphogenesis protein